MKLHTKQSVTEKKLSSFPLYYIYKYINACMTPWFLYLYIYTKINKSDLQKITSWFSFHIAMQIEKDMKWRRMIPHYTASFVELVVVIQTPPKWSQCHWFCFQCVSQLKLCSWYMIYTSLLELAPLFYSNDQHNILMWSSKLCSVRINRIFLHPALFFSLPSSSL